MARSTNKDYPDRESKVDVVGKIKKLVDDGDSVKDACDKFGITDFTYYSWRRLLKLTTLKKKSGLVIHDALPKVVKEKSGKFSLTVFKFSNIGVKDLSQIMDLA